ncbi:BrnA antitoxin family protein [Gallibacterium trehalosifermentans]|uniref:BrnA antitoxin family protein n=1 Tax=Gallibacterium trehalosifermentans TaxID=516935 RepID=A0ABV6GY13_9PAST
MKNIPYNPPINENGEARELTKADFARMKPIQDVMPAEFVAMAISHQAQREAEGKIKPRTRGKQKLPTKQSITIRLSPEVITAFKATGQGWQSRINEALLNYVRTSM